MSTISLVAVAVDVARFLEDATPLAVTCRALRCAAHFDSYLVADRQDFVDRCHACADDLEVRVARHTHEVRWRSCCGVRYWDVVGGSYAWFPALPARECLFCDRCLPPPREEAIP